jgi:hypothetical protein
MRIHLDPAIALAADSPANMMPWNGDKRILIDRSAFSRLFKRFVWSARFLDFQVRNLTVYGPPLKLLINIEYFNINKGSGKAIIFYTLFSTIPVGLNSLGGEHCFIS